MAVEEHQITWRNISILIKYDSNYLNAKDNSPNQLAHFDIYSDVPLPITETGYQSIFLTKSEVDESGGAIECVKEALDSAANSKEWIAYEIEKQQMCLF